MKRFGITLLIFIIAVPLIFGGILLVSYSTTTEDSIPLVSASANGQTAAPSSYAWHQPLIAGIMEKDFVEPATLDATALGQIDSTTLPVTISQRFGSEAVSLSEGGTMVWNGSLDEWNAYRLASSGNYVLELTLTNTKPAKGTGGYGSFVFRFSFSVKLKPQLQTSATRVLQGDVLAVTVSQLEGEVPVVTENPLESMSGGMQFSPNNQGGMTLFVPVAYNREPGDYTMVVQAGDVTWDISFTVVAAEFTRQNLTIDTSNPVISEANSDAAYKQYRDKIYPLFETVDPDTYWQGPFLMAATGRISTEYGLRRYTNGATTPTRHSGIDIAADENAPVVAPANGKVVLAEYLLNTGNTLVIEHGGGLKSYFYHMNELKVQVGDMVTRGDEVGLVGSTGYSTGPHLHYEVRIGNQAISPMLLFDGEGMLFYHPTGSGQAG